MEQSVITKADKAFEENRKLVALITLGNRAEVEQGKQLWLLKANNLFKKAIGDGIDTWVDYLKMPEVSISSSEANRKMDIYKIFILDYGFPEALVAEAKTKSLHYILPIVKDGDYEKDEVEIMILAAQTLSQKDLRERIYDIKTCDVGPRTYEFILMVRCRETKTLQKVHGVNHELLMARLRDIAQVNYYV